MDTKVVVRSLTLAVAAVAALFIPDYSSAQVEAPGELVAIPGATYSTWSVNEPIGSRTSTCSAPTRYLWRAAVTRPT